MQTRGKEDVFTVQISGNIQKCPAESVRLSNEDGWRTSILDKMQMQSLQTEEKSLKIGQY